MNWLAGCALLLIAAAGTRAMAAGCDVQAFLHGHKYGCCPYVMPAETSPDEIKWIADHGYTAMSLGFSGPYDGGNTDWSKLDAAVEMLAKDGRKSMLYFHPRFGDNEGISDVLNTGERIDHVWNRNPNYAIIDVFDPTQRAKFYDYLARAAGRYGPNPNVIGFVFGWGYMGETGFYIGDFLTNFDWIGSVSAGYSEHALLEYNRWRRDRGLQPIDKLPQPSSERQSDDYVDWMHFRSWYVGEIFERGAVDAMKARTDKPVGTFAYLPASTECYARNWAFVPNADFFRSAGSASTFDNTRTLQDSAIGWEDNWLHDGEWDFSAKRMICDEARMIAKGTVFHGMYARVYKTEPQWEKDVYEKVSEFLLTQDLRGQIKHENATVALFQPTWAASAFPGRGEKQPFLPTVGHRQFICWMVGLVESFGLPYKLVTEDDLLREERLSSYKLIVLPASDYAHRFLGAKRAKELLSDRRVLSISLRDKPITRSELRKLLGKRVEIPFDYEGETPVAGRVHNLVFNWTPNPIKVRALWSGKWRELGLGANAYEVLR